MPGTFFRPRLRRAFLALRSDRDWILSSAAAEVGSSWSWSWSWSECSEWSEWASSIVAGIWRRVIRDWRPQSIGRNRWDKLVCYGETWSTDLGCRTHVLWTFRGGAVRFARIKVGRCRHRQNPKISSTAAMPRRPFLPHLRSSCLDVSLSALVMVISPSHA
jgi:hypothetical protein